MDKRERRKKPNAQELFKRIGRNIRRNSFTPSLLRSFDWGL